MPSSTGEAIIFKVINVTRDRLMIGSEHILAFWFEDSLHADDIVLEVQVKRWFQCDEIFDGVIRKRFGHAVEKAGKGHFDHWAENSHGRLALIVLLDQFTRNIYRGTPRAYVFDSSARKLCWDGISDQADRNLAALERHFFYLPLLHSERIEDQEESVRFFKLLSESAPEKQINHFTNCLVAARRYRDIISLFGRFPHRNAILGRTSTADETAYLASMGEV